MSFKFITYDVEHGSSNALITPNKELILIDIGSREDFSPALHLKNDWKFEKLRWLTITHYDSDHLTDINNIAEHLRPAILESPAITPDRLVNLYGGIFSTPLEVFMEFKKDYSWPASPMSDASYDWGGVQFATFSNKYEDLETPSMNDMSVVTFSQYQGWTFCVPGDLEKQGWKRLLENEEFTNQLSRTDILVASHHGRESGFCEDVFNYCAPFLVIVSDKSISDTSVADKYYPKCKGLKVKNPLGEEIERKVLTTRKDGAIHIDIDYQGRYLITTSS